MRTSWKRSARQWPLGRACRPHGKEVAPGGSRSSGGSSRRLGVSVPGFLMVYAGLRNTMQW
jgi:hypothetical protein